MDTSNMLAQGTMLRGGTYRIERPLSSGGFGNTYLVRNVVFNELYAMKEFFMRGVNMRRGTAVTVSVPDNHSSYESQKEKFNTEAKRLRALNNAHIVKVHDLFEENGTVYYVMDFINGESLSERMKHQGRPFTEQETWQILPQLLDALKAVHEKELWHMDIKPGNIMLDTNGQAYLVDFGASKQFSKNGPQTSSAMCYTPGYAPVEQVEQDMEKFGP
ncbi:MAG: serine/threonine protein kinase, partial [Prevotella sp.]|nr:serine/threonine protein kinase [Prevotella sp.]